MTIEQITVINNAMSMLTDLMQLAGCSSSMEDFMEYTTEHVNALKEADVDMYIIEHVESLINTAIPIAEYSVQQNMEFTASFE